MPDEAKSGGTGKVGDRNPVINAAEKSDAPVVPKKLPNEAGAEEAIVVESVQNLGRLTDHPCCSFAILLVRCYRKATGIGHMKSRKEFP